MLPIRASRSPGPTKGYTGDHARSSAEAAGIELVVVKLAEAKRGFVLLPRRWVVERSFAWAAWCEPDKLDNGWFIKRVENTSARTRRENSSRCSRIASTIIVPLDVLEDLRLRMAVAPVADSINGLSLQRPEEALAHCVVPAVSPTTHARDDPLAIEQVQERIGGVLRASIAMEEKARRRATALDCHL